jgi:adenylate cyclase
MSNRVGGRPDGHLRRERAVVLHADIAGYSRLLADDPGATVDAVRAYHDLVTAAVETAGGTLVNFVGDSFTAVFADARTGMRCAIAICGAVKERNAGLPETRRVAFRMGLDAGEVAIADDGRFFGDPINIAARVQAMADVGGINVTEAIYRELDEPAMRLRPLGA